MNIKINIVVLFLFMTTLSSLAQGIRMSFTEMTGDEKSAFVTALQALKDSGFIDDMAQFHSNYFDTDAITTCCTNNPGSACCANTASSIHYNFLNNSGTQGIRHFNKDVFLAWHRRFLLELEQALKNIDPTINLPYWDWTSSRSTSTSSGQIWASNFLGQFNNAWGLNRSLGQADTLPTSTEVNNLKSETNWGRFSYLFEGDPSRNINSIHAKPHSWVGGIMGQGGSPGDPVFYLHHAMVDKIWQEWIEARGHTSNTNLHGKTSMPRYDGSNYSATYTVNNTTATSTIFNQTVNPDTMNNSDEIGVFYAENQYVLLNNYTVSNQYLQQEVFRYDYEIEVGDNFIVPSGARVVFDSPNIVLDEGFHAEDGAEVLICNTYDNTGCQIYNSSSRQSSGSIEVFSTVVETLEENNEEKLNIYPNPFKEMATIVFHLDHASEVLVELADLNGRIVKILEPVRRRKAGMHKINVSGQDLSTGIYLVRLKTDTYTETKRLVFSGR